jgi:predicted permease
MLRPAFEFWRNLWRNLIHPRALHRDVDEEVRGAFESLVEERMRAGVAETEARREATLAFGRVETVKAQVLDARAGAFWDPLRQDVRFGIRLLIRRPLFAIFAAASLALAIGATGAIFSLFDRLVLRTLPVSEPERLVVASFGGPNGRFNYSLPYPHYEALRARSTTLAGIFAMVPFGRVTLTLGGESDIAQSLHVTGDYYRVLGLTPALGRLLQPGDDRPGQAVAVLNHSYWQRRFGSRPDILGAAVTLNGVPFTIVGVEPAGFAGTEVGRPYDVAVPMRALELLKDVPPPWNEAFATWIYIMGRLKPGVTLAEAERETQVIFERASLDGAHTPGEQRLAREHRLRLESGATGSASDLRDSYARWLELLLIVLGSVLLLASLNVATLLLSQSDARQREMSTRLALGAGRGRIIRQLLTESLILATIAAAIGWLLASWGSQVLLRMATSTRDRLPLDVTPDLRLLLFTLAVSGGTCLLFGLIPAIRSTSPRRLLANRQLGGGPRRGTLDRTLIVAQVGLSLVLLVGAGLFLRTLGQLWAQDTGYDRRNVLMFSVDARLIGKHGADVPATYRRVLEELRAVPGAQVISASMVRPVSDTYYFVDVVSQVGERMLGDDQRIRVAFNPVAPRYFETFGIPLVAGRDFDARDTPESPKVIIISERMARHFTGNPVGQRIGRDKNVREVIGVARDIRYANVKDAPREVLYLPLLQGQPQDFRYTPSFEIRYAGAVGDIVRAAHEAVSRVDSGLQMFATRTLEEQTEASFAAERLLALLMSWFGAFALALSCIGLYGVMSDRVTLRTAEIGLRLALGAQQRTVSWLVLREALITVAIGVTLGLAAAFAAVQLIRSQLFGVEPHDPLALTGATLLLLTIACAAAYLPAHRASRIDPLRALRHE